MPVSVLERALPRAMQTSLRRRVLALAAAALAVITASEVYALIAQGQAGWVFAFASAIAAIGLFVLMARMLSAVTEVAHLLEAGAEGAGARAAPGAEIDSAERLRANAEAMAARLEKLKRRPRRNPLTGLPLQEEFLTVAADDIESKPRAVLLGLVRLTNYEAMAAFDPMAAEQVLSLFAQRLRQALDQSRFLAHIDRDCFAIWFRGVAPHKESAAELQALSYVLSQEIEAANFTVTPDVQIGSALYPIDSTDAANLLSRAFVSLARPQRTVDGGLVFFAPRSPEETRRRFTLEQKLRQAIEQQQLELHYQPLVDVGAGAVTGAEALLRWRHPSLGAISPVEFVPLLEETGLVEEIGLWTINAACRQLRAWRDAGFNLKVAINISARQLHDPLLGKMISRTLAAHKLAPGDLELELTETAAMEDIERTQTLFAELRGEGFGLAIDDFGSGYSSLGYLKNLPFTKLKIDREFVTHVDTRSGSRAICKALIELCRGLDIVVLAEGVERHEEVETLERLGCNTFQGFYFSPALPAQDLTAMLVRPDWQALLQSPIHRRQVELRRRIGE